MTPNRLTSGHRGPRPPPSANTPGALLDQAFTRTAGAPLVRGNRVRLLKNAAENYPAWLDAIRAAERMVHFESYIIYDDEAGAVFADAFIGKAKEGVAVRVIYDWIGGLGKTSPRFWRELTRAGVEVRCVNPLRVARPFDLLHREHRKSITVDGRVGFVAGLCVGTMWAGDLARGLEPWRDTGVEIRGPAVADIARAFGEVWAATGPPLPASGYLQAPPSGADGNVALRVVASTPRSTRMLRLDQLVAAAARETLWLTDPYFAGTASYIQALRVAALDGVDVRLLVPGATDIPLLRPISLAGYRPLLEAGVRVFQWEGPMLHAKTSVADGRWGRVGSTNLNLASWVGNFELDVVVEDERFGAALQAMYLDDLNGSTELILGAEWTDRRITVHSSREPRGGRSDSDQGRRFRSAGRHASGVATGAVRLGNAVSAAIADRRTFAYAEDGIIGGAGLLLLVVAWIGVLWPRVLTIPMALLAAWLGAALLVKAFSLHRQRPPRAR